MTKITLTIEQDKEHGTDKGMQDTIALLKELDTRQPAKMVLTLEPYPGRDQLLLIELRELLRRRPPGITVKIRTVDEEEVDVVRLPKTTPMDKTWNTTFDEFNQRYSTTVVIGPIGGRAEESLDDNRRQEDDADDDEVVWEGEPAAVVAPADETERHEPDDDDAEVDWEDAPPPTGAVTDEMVIDAANVDWEQIAGR